MNKKQRILLTIGIIFISFNLRAPLTAVGSIIKLIQDQYNLSSTMAGFITTLPLISFAVVSPFVFKISSKLGYGKTMTIGLLLILFGEAIRSYTGVYGLFIGTIILGIGIAIGNVLIPSIIKQRYDNKIGLMVSIYTSSMCIFAAIGAGISFPLSSWSNFGWQNSLFIWAFLCIVTIVIWLPQYNTKTKEKEVLVITKSSSSIWKDKTAWWVTIFMGTQSLMFYTLVAWLPSIITSKGLSNNFASSMALTFQLMAIPATLIIPILADKFKTQRVLVITTSILYIIGLSCLFSSSELSIIFAIIFMALGMGGSISLSIAFISLRSPNANRATELSGMSQSAGYLLAAFGPLLIGFLFDTTNTWTIPISILCALGVFLIVCGWFSGSNVKTKE